MSFNPQTYLQNKFSHSRDKNITFDEPTHIYTIRLLNKKNENNNNNYNNGHKNENKRYDNETEINQTEFIYDSGFTSVTTWVHSHFHSFDADKIIDKMMNSRNWFKSKYYGMTREEIKQEWERNRDEAAKAGTNMHYDIECFYNEISTINDSIEYQYFQEFEKDRTKEGGFGENIEPYRTEWMVYDEDLRLSGSIDMIFRRKDNHEILEIYDWKRCREIKKQNPWQSAETECINHLPDSNFWHYSLQLNIYKAILERKYGKKVDGLYLVCLHPNNKNKSYQRIKVPILKDEINDLIEYRVKQVNQYKK